MPPLALLLAIAVGGGLSGGFQPETAPIVAVAYRGTPAGVPRADELAAIRALGFTGVSWPQSGTAGLAELSRLAASLDIAVVGAPGVLIKVDRAVPDLQAVLWRAIARGAKVITLDAGRSAGAGLADGKGNRLPWTRTASTFASQLAASPRLYMNLKRGPAVTIVSPPPAGPAGPAGVEVALLDGGRAWVLIATSTARAQVRAVAQLPLGVPPALWLSLLDGSMMSMLKQPAGPRWTFTIGPGAALVYVIDKAPKLGNW